MQKFLLLIHLCIISPSFSQKKVKYDCSFEREDKKGCSYIITTQETDNVRLDFYNCTSQLIKTVHYSDKYEINERNLNGLKILYNYDGSIFSSGNFKMGLKDGIWETNFRNRTKSIETFQSGTALKTINLNEDNDTSSIEEYTAKQSVFKFYTKGKLTKIKRPNYLGKDSIVELIEANNIRIVDYKDSFNTEDTIIPFKEEEHSQRMPEFMGGQDKFSEYIENNMVYPNDAINNNICGIVKIKFVIDVDGTVIDIKLADVPSQHPALEKEALRLIEKSSGMWKAGMQDNIPVKVLCIIPIEFYIE